MGQTVGTDGNLKVRKALPLVYFCSRMLKTLLKIHLKVKSEGFQHKNSEKNREPTFSPENVKKTKGL